MSIKSHITKPTWLPLRHRAEEAAASLPDLIVAAEKAAASVLSGGHRQHKTGPGERFWQFREYDPSDRPQDIDWRQSGKGDRVFIRQKEWQTTQTMLFWLQGGKGMSYRSAPALPEKKTEAIVLALALSLLFTRRGELVGLLDGSHRPGRSAPALQNLGEDLLRVPANLLPKSTMRRLPAHAGVILIGDFLSDTQDIGNMMNQFAGRTTGGLMLQILDPAEIGLPFAGRMIFEESDAPNEHHILNVESVRDAYKKRIENHMEALRLMCRRHQWHYVLHRTGGGLTETLFNIWRVFGDEDAENGRS